LLTPVLGALFAAFPAAGYDVTYELDGAQRTVRMDHDPGDRIPVKDGEPLVSRS
jgi:uncharacterized protein YcfJ